jgi:hypothetical protein
MEFRLPPLVGKVDEQAEQGYDERRALAIEWMRRKRIKWVGKDMTSWLRKQAKRGV